MTAMVVAVTGLGSVWRRRFGTDPDDPRRFARAAYYNTTGVPLDGSIRTRLKVVGHARFNSTGGFDPNYPRRTINRVFECAEPCVWQGQNKILFKCLLAVPRRPDYFLVVIRQSDIGHVRLGSSDWKSNGSLLIAFSECGNQQEAMLLVRAGGWVRTDGGIFVLKPMADRPWVAHVQLTSS
jgi:hypothetical protein